MNVESYVTPTVAVIDSCLGLTDGAGHPLPPCMFEVNKIYIGYRQCYTKDPMVDPQYDYDKLHALLVAYHDNDTANVEKLYDKYGKEDYLQYFHKCSFIAKHINHESPLEHGHLTVRITGISRALSHQLIRHRLASPSQQSQRYCDEGDATFTMPPSIARHKEAAQLYDKTLDFITSAVAALQEAGIPKEDVRFLLPNATSTQIVLTANFREWKHIFNERCCMKAQWEIRNVCNQIWDYLRGNVPLIFDPQYGGGPKCTKFGKCTEQNGCANIPY